MFKQFFKTLVLGLTSGMACAAGGWAWKNCMEGKANNVKQEYDKQKEERLREAKENV